jgi:hypothetical protein
MAILGGFVLRHNAAHGAWYCHRARFVHEPCTVVMQRSLWYCGPSYAGMHLRIAEDPVLPLQLLAGSTILALHYGCGT